MGNLKTKGNVNLKQPFKCNHCVRRPRYFETRRTLTNHVHKFHKDDPLPPPPPRRRRKLVLLPSSDEEEEEAKPAVLTRSKGKGTDTEQDQVAPFIPDLTPLERAAWYQVYQSRDSWVRASGKDVWAAVQRRPRTRHLCGTCRKGFRTLRALDGHRSSWHVKANTTAVGGPFILESGEVLNQK